ncbi:hypothetical protein F5Y03DRAFT_353640 [Xylaria venustula]|nr:hypothetical protein F5Y03DRAFT_353640 [Xylaria venustula]
MKHRIRLISQGIRAGIHTSQIQIQPRSTLRISPRFTIAASPKATQKEVINKLKKHVGKGSKRPHIRALRIDAVAILSSKEFTSWIEDERFMSAFLETLFKPMSSDLASGPGLNVLSGVTDGLSPRLESGEPHSGFAVLCGPVKKILPRLWNKEFFAATSSDEAACVSFVTNPLYGNTGALEVTLPLANTVFQNGRRSSLYASRWDVSNEGWVALRRRDPKIRQVIGAMGNPAHFVPTKSMIPLLPITPPRKILAGLGNIVRQVEINGSATPASKELEVIIPKVFEERGRGRRTPPKPIGVWCWVIPPHVMEAVDFGDLVLFKAGSSQTDAPTITGSEKVFSKLLSSGCRLHKVLSGGGGWGLKQGLLSLDPETKFSLPGQDDDMETFIRSFKERNSAEPTSGLAAPGSFLLFCIETETSAIRAEASNIRAEMSTIEAEVSTIEAEASAIKAEASTIKAKASTIKAEASAIEAEASTIKAEASTIKAEVSTIKAEALTLEAEASIIEAEASTIAASGPTARRTCHFGVAPNADYTPSPSPRRRPVKVIDGYFRVSSAAGLYLRAIPDHTGFASESKTKVASQDSFTTKIDVPGSYLGAR